MNLGALLALVKLAQDTEVLEKKKVPRVRPVKKSTKPQAKVQSKPFIKFFDIPIGYAGLGLPPPETVLTEKQKRALR
jgi:hypothetical protein